MSFVPQIPREPLARLRLMSLWFVLFAITVDVVAVSTSQFAPLPARIAGLTASMALLGWVLLGYRRGRFPEWTTPFEAVLLVAITGASFMPLRAMGMFISLLMLRALYVSRREFWLLPVSYGIARSAGMAITADPKPYGALSSTVLFQFIGLLFIGFILFMLMQALAAQERVERQMREAQKMEAVGQLAGGIAHDFNNLLTVIGGHVYMLERHATGSAVVTKHLDGINETVERAGSLTRQLLAFGRRQVLHPATVDLNAVIRSTARLLEPVVGERVRLEMELDPALPAVHADVGQLEQVLLNLGLNARDAMPIGGTMRIRTSSAGGNVLVSFADSGVGMDAETAAHVFEPFFTTKRGGRGTGLGLATAYGIIKQSGGDISVTSAPGKGSTFAITLPVAAEPARAVARAMDGIPVMPSGLKARRILVVEDNDGVREFVRSALVNSGAAVDVAVDGVDGLAIARAEGYAFDLVVTDVVMPGMSGPQMVDRLREIRPDLPVLFMTGYAEDADALQELNTGKQGLLEKPFSARALIEAVQVVTSQTPGIAPVATQS